MKTSMFEKGIPMLARACTLAGALAAVLVFAGAGCSFTDNNTPQGSRCNPLDSHNECSSGSVCTGQGSSPTIPFCAENYCCSVDSNGNIDSADPHCQPGCNGGAASICKATSDPGACAFAAGATLEAALAMDEDGGAAATLDAAVEAAAALDAAEADAGLDSTATEGGD
jgi:hypothetical protein